MLPAFNKNELLPAGIHTADWSEFTIRFGFSLRRQHLLQGLAVALRNLQQAGCTLAYVDGSFVTAKQEPGDFDACWSMVGVDPVRLDPVRLDPVRLDPVLLDFSDGRTAQKAKYSGELFPAELPEGASGRTFLDFFQTDRNTGDAKGIVQIDVQTQDFSTVSTSS